MNKDLATLIQDLLFAAEIVRIRASELGESIGSLNTHSQHNQQRGLKEFEVVLTIRTVGNCHLRLAVVLRASFGHPLHGDHEALPHPNQPSNILSKPVLKAMETILCILSCREGENGEFQHEVFKLISRDNCSIVCNCCLVERFDHRAKSRWQHCNLEIEKTPKYLGDFFSLLNDIFVLLTSNILRFRRNCGRILSDFCGNLRNCNRLRSNVCSSSRCQPATGCHNNGGDTNDRSNNYRPSLPPNHAIVDTQRTTTKKTVQQTHSLIPLWIGRHFAMGKKCPQAASYA